MKYFIPVISVLLFVANLLSSEKKMIPKNSQESKLYMKGMELIDQKQYDQAVAEFKKMIRLNSEFPQPYLKIGLIHEIRSNYHKAIPYFINYFDMGGERSTVIKKAISDIANLVHATNDKEYGKIKKGLIPYEKGLKLMSEEDYEDAIDEFDEAIEIIPYHINAHFNMGLAYYYEKKYFNALASFNQVIRYDQDNPEFIDSYYYKARIYDDLLIHKFDTAMSNYLIHKKSGGKKDSDKRIELIKQVNDMISDAQKESDQKQYEKANNLLKQAKKKQPYNVKIYNLLAVNYIKSDEFGDAEDELEDALEIKKNVGDTYYNFTWMHARAGDDDEAIEYFEKGINYYSKDNIKAVLREPDFRNLLKKNKFKIMVMKAVQ